MTTLVAETRKQREIRTREQQILRVARDHLVAGGYLGLNMDRIAAEIEYSKGTIYQHFRNKEEILLALANEALATRTRMFEAAAAVEEPTRVRMATIGAASEAFFELFPHYFMVEQVVRASSIWEKTSAERRALMELCERRCMGTAVTVVHAGVAAGDLRLPDGTRPEEVVFGLWSLSFGAQTIASSSPVLTEIGIADPRVALRHNWNRLLDGWGWAPLSCDFDYAAYMDLAKERRFRHEQFATA
ncbi:MAG: TetR/AcrR family transcriptional regulator [Lacipirellulaceae bacterium]